MPLHVIHYIIIFSYIHEAVIAGWDLKVGVFFLSILFSLHFCQAPQSFLSILTGH